MPLASRRAAADSRDPMAPGVESLNVAAAAAVALYEVARDRPPPDPQDASEDEEMPA